MRRLDLGSKDARKKQQKILKHLKRWLSANPHIDGEVISGGNKSKHNTKIRCPNGKKVPVSGSPSDVNSWKMMQKSLIKNGFPKEAVMYFLQNLIDDVEEVEDYTPFFSFWSSGYCSEIDAFTDEHNTLLPFDVFKDHPYVKVGALLQVPFESDIHVVPSDFSAVKIISENKKEHMFLITSIDYLPKHTGHMMVLSGSMNGHQGVLHCLGLGDTDFVSLTDDFFGLMYAS
jgi:hypothetical protein